MPIETTRLIRTRMQRRRGKDLERRGAEFVDENARRARVPKTCPQGTVVVNEPRAAGWMALVQAVQKATLWATD